MTNDQCRRRFSRKTVSVRFNSYLNIEYVEVRARLASDDTIVGDPFLLVKPRREPVCAFGVCQVSGDDDSAGVHVRLQVFAESLNMYRVGRQVEEKVL